MWKPGMSYLQHLECVHDFNMAYSLDFLGILWLISYEITQDKSICRQTCCTILIMFMYIFFLSSLFLVIVTFNYFTSVLIFIYSECSSSCEAHYTGIL